MPNKEANKQTKPFSNVCPLKTEKKTKARTEKKKDNKQNPADHKSCLFSRGFKTERGMSNR